MRKEFILKFLIGLISILILTGCSQSNQYNNALAEYKKIDKLYDEANVIEERIDTKTDQVGDGDRISQIDNEIKESITTLNSVFESLIDSEKVKFGEYLFKSVKASTLDYVALVIKEDSSFDRNGLLIKILFSDNGLGSVAAFIERENAVNSLLGKWYCSKRNSINSMEINLEFYKQEDGKLYYKREMIDSSGGSAGSLIEGYVSTTSDQTMFKVNYLKGDGFILAAPKGDTLYEFFDDRKANEFRKVE